MKKYKIIYTDGNMEVIACYNVISITIGFLFAYEEGLSLVSATTENCMFINVSCIKKLYCIQER